jgi:WD40 repeat protein
MHGLVVGSAPMVSDGRLFSIFVFDSHSIMVHITLPTIQLSYVGTYVGAGSSASGLIFIWETKTGLLKRKLAGHETGVCGFSWGRGGTSGQQVASVDRDGTLILWA